MKIGSYELNRQNIFRDLISGFSVAVVSIPEGMAFALVAGVDPIYGLYSGTIATFVGAFSTGSRLMVVTLTNTLAISVASVFTSMGGGFKIETLFMLTVLVGLVQLLLGVFKLGKILYYVSNAVMSGFIFGAALLIILSQLNNLTGYNSQGSNALHKTINWISNVNQFDLTTVLVGIGTILLIILLTQIRVLKNLSYVISILLVTIFLYFIKLPSVELIGDTFKIPQGLPNFVLPNYLAIPGLLIPAIALGLIGLIESAGVRMAFPDKNQNITGFSRDFLGQGLANTVGGFFQGMPTGGSFTRSALNIQSGAKSRLSAIIAAIFILAVLLVLGPAAEKIPFTGLAAVLVVIGSSVLFQLCHDIVMVWNTSKASTVAMFLTFFATLIMPLYYAIFVGVIISFILYIFSSSTGLSVVALSRLKSGKYIENKVPAVLPSNDITIIYTHGNLFFAVINKLEDRMPSYNNTTNAVLIFRIRGKKSVNSTMLVWLQKYAQDLRNKSNLLMLSGVDEDAMKQLKRTGVAEVIGKENIFLAKKTLEASTDDAYEAAQKWFKEHR